ncbi:hypothetical protein [Crystallibacter crystallopoietes]|uniref:hypothetical protein n=1 Tax=Crystallibacter crystallopoietes TaxID=37928 RepID=UPI0005C1F40C|nr:hypothetical protein [Arthrobacter crystallopoietes]
MSHRSPVALTTAVSALLVSLTACGASLGSGPQACTEIGAVAGISLTVASSFAPEVEAVELEACWEGTCRPVAVELYPGEDMVDLGCDSALPEGSCSATATPNGTLTGFTEVRGLPEADVESVATVTHPDGSETTTAPLTAAARMVYPNGEQCPGAAPQLGLLLDGTGLHPA